MEENKEILIQDVSDVNEVELFEQYNLYRRDKTPKKPLYFAPYFTAKSGKVIGINHLSKIIGVLRFMRSEVNYVLEDLEGFTISKLQKDKWIKGIQQDSNFSNEKEIQTYYFLDSPLKLKKSLVKCGWLLRQLPPNYSRSFTDFIKHFSIDY